MHALSRSRRRQLLTTRISAAAMTAALTLVAVPNATAVTGTTDLNTETPTGLAAALVGPGVLIANATHSGAPAAAGTFSGGASSIGFDTGVLLASGAIADATGPNTADSTGSAYGLPGDAALSSLAGVPTFDASILAFDFTPNADTVFFQYVFASEEYNEFVNTNFNDVFAFFVNGINCAVVDTGSGLAPVSINTINNGNPAGDTTATNPSLYRNNDLQDGGGSINTEYDGLTVVLTCMAPVTPNAVNHMRLAIADGSDGAWDSGVFLKQGSLSTTPPAGTGKVTGGGRLDLVGGAVTLGTTVIDDAQGLRGNLQLNDHRTGDRFHGYDVTSMTADLATGTATWVGNGRWNGEDGYGFEAVIVDNRNGNSTKKGDPDTVSVVVKDGAGAVVWSTQGAQPLTRGNITLHDS